VIERWEAEIEREIRVNGVHVVRCCIKALAKSCVVQFT
jgi:hypothetical protein